MQDRTFDVRHLDVRESNRRRVRGTLLSMSETAQMVLDREEERVLLWRAEVLERAGYDKCLAGILSAVSDVDLHFATDLLRRGCPPRLAIQILL